MSISRWVSLTYLLMACRRRFTYTRAIGVTLLSAMKCLNSSTEGTGIFQSLQRRLGWCVTFDVPASFCVNWSDISEKLLSFHHFRYPVLQLWYMPPLHSLSFFILFLLSVLILAFYHFSLLLFLWVFKFSNPNGFFFLHVDRRLLMYHWWIQQQ